MVHLGFKVCVHGRSVYVPGYQGGVTYQEGVWVIPRGGCGPLTVFTDLGAAETHVRDRGLAEVPGIEIRECRYFLSMVDHVWCRKSSMYGVPSSVELRLMPPGTALADRVRVGKRVWP